MTLLYFFSMAYMIIHLSFVVYKKGEQLRIKVSNYSHPASDESYLQKWSMRIKRLTIEIKALFNKKYKLMKKEINKGYLVPFSEEFTEVMIDDRFVREVFDEVVLIFDFKEYIEYKKFPFVDNFEVSRRAQFYPKKVELTEVQNREFIKILINKYHSGMIKEIELPEWENKLRNAGLIPTEKSKTVESLSDVFESNEETTTILEREIIKKKASRFDSII